MSGSKPNFNTRFAARLAQQNDPARKANLDAIAALEEFPEEAASKQEIQSVGPDILGKPPGTPIFYGAIQLSRDGGTYLGEPGLPSGSHGRNEFGTPGPVGQPQPSMGARPSKRRRISPPRRSPGSQIVSSVEASPRSSSGFAEAAAHPKTAKEDIGRGSHYIRSMAPALASSLDPAHVSASSARESRAVTGAVVLSTVGPLNSQSSGVYSQTSIVPGRGPSQSSSNLERMLGAGISPSDEMRRVFGRAVDRMLPNAETPATPRIAGIEDNDLDGHISRVAPILATAYSQLVNAGFASPLQLQDGANPFPALHQSLQRPEANADPSEISRSGTTTMHNFRKPKHRPPDSGGQSPNIRSGGSPASAPSSRGTSLSSTLNHARDTHLHNGGEQIGTRSKEQDRMSGDHSEHSATKVNGQGVLRLPKEGTHGTPAAVTVQAEAIPSEVGTLESSISNLNEYLAKLEMELQAAVFGSSDRPSMSAHVKEQEPPTVVLEFLGPLRLSTGRFTFEVALSEAEAANRWSRRNDVFDPQGDYLEYALDAQKHNHVHNWGPVDDGTVMILLNGKEIASPNATGSIKTHIMTSGIVQGVNTLEIFALVDATQWTFRVKRSGPSKEEMQRQFQQASAWRILAS